MTLINQCNYTVWPALSSNVSLSTTGFVLPSGENSSVNVPVNWVGRIWGRTLCTTDSVTGKFSCATGDCSSGKIACNGRQGSPPNTLVEFSLDINDTDYYDVSLVDGFNVPVIVVPMSSSGATGEELRKQIGVATYIECSSKTQQDVKAVFDTAIKVVLQALRRKEMARKRRHRGLVARLFISSSQDPVKTLKGIYIKTKNWKELLTDEPFTRDDLITIRNPNALDDRVLLDFDHVKNDLKVDDEGMLAHSSYVSYKSHSS
ncbi:Ras-related C3 botulinum toxin substrate 1 [Vigna unguiculata]|uniref:Ras-related C3 botulinum toxin substrate 1 n=1 Tax=Vigna unguiculata TaxID=3917 RepID=A0A4D6KY78_VIGUN|nr:Ras-related C3 botulinum toxin substrate 1 [Vigna unguiculata]